MAIANSTFIDQVVTVVTPDSPSVEELSVQEALDLWKEQWGEYTKYILVMPDSGDFTFYDTSEFTIDIAKALTAAGVDENISEIQIHGEFVYVASNQGSSWSLWQHTEESRAEFEKESEKTPKELARSDDPLERVKAAEAGVWHEVLAEDEDYRVRLAVIANNDEIAETMVEDNDYRVRKAVAEKGYGLDKLIRDDNHNVRVIIAEKGYGLDILAEDDNTNVRKAVARHCGAAEAEILRDDPCYFVRVELAKRGFNLDHYVNDDNINVQLEVAKRGHALDTFINSRSRHILIAVAENGYGLDQLENNPDIKVVEAVKKYRAEHKS